MTPCTQNVNFSEVSGPLAVGNQVLQTIRISCKPLKTIHLSRVELFVPLFVWLPITGQTHRFDDLYVGHSVHQIISMLDCIFVTPCAG
jgi:hypothetical protein